MRQSDVPTDIKAIIQLAQLKGSLRKEVSIVAEGLGVSGAYASARLGIHGLFDPSSWEGLEHRADPMQVLPGRPGNSTFRAIYGSEETLAGITPGRLPSNGHQEGSNGSSSAHIHPAPVKPKKKRRFSKAGRQAMKDAQARRWAKHKGTAQPVAAKPKIAASKSAKPKHSHGYPEGHGYGNPEVMKFFRTHPVKAYAAKDLVAGAEPARRKAAVGNAPQALVALADKGLLIKVDRGQYKLNRSAKKPMPIAKKGPKKAVKKKPKAVKTSSPTVAAQTVQEVLSQSAPIQEPAA